MPRILHASIAMQHIRCNCVSFAYFWINLNIDWSLIDVDQSSNAHCRLSTFNSYWTLNIEPPNAMYHRMNDQHATRSSSYSMIQAPPKSAMENCPGMMTLFPPPPYKPHPRVLYSTIKLPSRYSNDTIIVHEFVMLQEFVILDFLPPSIC